MAAGFPVKADYVTGDVLSAANMNDLAGTLNYLDPTAKGDLFPASSGTALTRLAVGANDTVLTADSTTATGLKWAAAGGGGGGGKVLQVVSTTKTDTFTSNSTTNVDITGLSATITPSSATSTILVMLDLTGSGIPAASYMTYQLVRNSTAIAIGDASGSRTRASNTIYGAVTGVLGSASNTFLDSPSTTSATTYKIQGRINTSGTFYVNRADTDTDFSTFARTVSSITLMEIGA
jgi:hypothetical protein